MWTNDLFGVQKPIIALLHLRALPGDPLFEKADTIETVVGHARKELHVLQDGGIDGVLFANEFSLPYQRQANAVTIAAMSYIIGRVREDIRVPFGVNVVLNPMASIETAVAVNADFVRNTFTGAYIGESGIKDTDVAAYVRKRCELNRKNLKMLYKVNPESDAYVAPRSLQNITKSIVFHCFPDGLCVSGTGAGTETDDQIIADVKRVSGEVPVFCNTGCTAQNIATKLSIADGACVGTALKTDGKIENFADPKMVEAFMKEVYAFRNTLTP